MQIAEPFFRNCAVLIAWQEDQYSHHGFIWNRKMTNYSIGNYAAITSNKEKRVLQLYLNRLFENIHCFVLDILSKNHVGTMKVVWILLS